MLNVAGFQEKPTIGPTASFYAATAVRACLGSLSLSLRDSVETEKSYKSRFHRYCSRGWLGSIQFACIVVFVSCVCPVFVSLPPLFLLAASINETHQKVQMHSLAPPLEISRW